MSHKKSCSSNKIVERIHTGDSNDADVFGACDCKQDETPPMNQNTSIKWPVKGELEWGISLTQADGECIVTQEQLNELCQLANHVHELQQQLESLVDVTETLMRNYPGTIIWFFTCKEVKAQLIAFRALVEKGKK